MLGKYCPQIEIVGVADTLETAVTIISSLRPDVVFLDIELPDGSGFKVLDRLPNLSFSVIFVTAYEHYALKALKRSALDYLLKPLDIDDLVAAVQKLPPLSTVTKHLEEQSMILNSYINGAPRDQYIMALPTIDGLIFIHDEEVITCRSDSNYTHLTLTNNRKFLVSRTLNDIEEMLSEDLFCRVHHSNIVNLKHIRRYFKGKGGYLEMSDGSTVEVSSRKKNDFLARFA
jgi:two-component system, LytTR family, response regulator